MIDKSKIIVTINRNEMVRRYQLNIRNDDGSMTEIGGPMRSEDFYWAHGFDCEWPHGENEYYENKRKGGA